MHTTLRLPRTVVEFAGVNPTYQSTPALLLPTSQPIDTPSQPSALAHVAPAASSPSPTVDDVESTPIMPAKGEEKGSHSPPEQEAPQEKNMASN